MLQRCLRREWIGEREREREREREQIVSKPLLDSSEEVSSVAQHTSMQVCLIQKKLLELQMVNK